jgi:hypothetical protein
MSVSVCVCRASEVRGRLIYLDNSFMIKEGDRYEKKKHLYYRFTIYGDGVW